jgi:excisionase family DNA binding protein
MQRKTNINKAMQTIKETLTVEEVAAYTGMKKTYIYKLCHLRQIPHFKPMGKMTYFNKDEIDQWLQRNRVETAEQSNVKAATHAVTK